MSETQTPEVLSCPRCGSGKYTTYEAIEKRDKTKPFVGPKPPALSRTDDKTYICSSCGELEAMEDFSGTRLSQEWWENPPK